jgi:hypothetical protein
MKRYSLFRQRNAIFPSCEDEQKEEKRQAMHTTIVIDSPSLQNLRTRLQGSALVPDDQGYDEACLT